MATKLLLIKDVEALGRSGDIVSVKPGFGRNYLLPQKLAVIADKKALQQQERLVEERKKRAESDKKESNELADKINGITLTTTVKVDHDGHMYGSVNAHDIAELLQEQQKVELDKRQIQLKHPIKATGVHEISVKLKEGVVASFHLKVMTEEQLSQSQEEQSQAS